MRKDYHLEITRHSLSHLEETSIPQTLFHYTKEDIKLIIQSDLRIRAYELFSMEDKSEFHYGLGIFEKLVRQKNLFPIFQNIISFTKNEILDLATIQFFVLSLTQNANSGLHYEKFSKGSQGKVVVNTKNLNLAHQYDSYLKPSQKANMIQMSTVTYSKKNHFSHFESLIEKYLKLYVEIIGCTNYSDQENQIARLNLGTFQSIVVLALLCKRPNYSWEEEIRVIVLLSKGFPSIDLYPDLKSRRFVDLLLEEK